MRIGRLGAMKGAVQVDINHRPPGVEGHIGERHDKVASRVGNQDIQASEGRNSGGDCRLNSLGISDIGHDGHGLPAFGFDCQRSGGNALGVAAGQHDLRPRRRQTARDGKADAATTSGNKRRAALQAIRGK